MVEVCERSRKSLGTFTEEAAGGRDGAEVLISTLAFLNFLSGRADRYHHHLVRSSNHDEDEGRRVAKPRRQLTSIPHSRANSWLELMTGSRSSLLPPCLWPFEQWLLNERFLPQSFPFPPPPPSLCSRFENSQLSFEIYDSLSLSLVPSRKSSLPRLIILSRVKKKRGSLLFFSIRCMHARVHTR